MTYLMALLPAMSFMDWNERAKNCVFKEHLSAIIYVTAQELDYVDKKRDLGFSLLSDTRRLFIDEKINILPIYDWLHPDDPEAFTTAIGLTAEQLPALYLLQAELGEVIPIDLKREDGLSWTPELFGHYT